MKLYIDKELCTGCGACIKTCPFDALSLHNGKAVVDQSLCSFCADCVHACRVGAISLLLDEATIQDNPSMDASEKVFFNMPMQNRISDRMPGAGLGEGRGRRGGNGRGGGRGRKMGRKRRSW